MTTQNTTSKNNGLGTCVGIDLGATTNLTTNKLNNMKIYHYVTGVLNPTCKEVLNDYDSDIDNDDSDDDSDDDSVVCVATFGN